MRHRLRSARHVVAVALVVGTLLAACSDSSDGTARPSPTPTPPPDDPPTMQPIPASWDNGADPVQLPGGLLLVDCEGDAPLLCVQRDGRTIGLLALDSFPLTQELAEAEDEAELKAAFEAYVARRMADVRADRAAGCGDGYRFTPDTTVPTTIGPLPGVRFGFTGTENGATTEHVVQYATVAGGQLWLATVEAASADGCMASPELTVFDPAVLAEVLPTLDRVVAGTALPEAGWRVEDGTVVGVDGGLDGGLVYVIVDGRLQRIQQPRAMTAQDVAKEGLRRGQTVTHVRAASGSTGSFFAVVPPDGKQARLHLVSDGVMYPVVVQLIQPWAIEDMAETEDSVLDRLEAVQA